MVITIEPKSVIDQSTQVDFVVILTKVQTVFEKVYNNLKVLYCFL